jgi:hypothetical protein
VQDPGFIHQYCQNNNNLEGMIIKEAHLTQDFLFPLNYYEIFGDEIFSMSTIV